MRAEISTVTMTTTVAADVSFRVGQVTFSSSRVTSTTDANTCSLRYATTAAVPADDQRNAR